MSSTIRIKCHFLNQLGYYIYICFTNIERLIHILTVKVINSSYWKIIDQEYCEYKYASIYITGLTENPTSNYIDNEKAKQ